MAGAVVDTDVISFLLRMDTRRELYRGHLAGRALVVTFMTVAELERWAIKYRWGAQRRRALEVYLSNCAIQHSTSVLCRQWAEVITATERVGRRISRTDAWQAATALVHDIPLVTHNRRDYTAVPGLTVISEAPS
jgi:tRNA(fMet)-specific endonuclease VapC